MGVNDPLTTRQYSLDRMRVRDAWSLTKGGSTVVAVVDTGVQFNHPDLQGRLLGGYDFVNRDSDASDDNGHGTWVSGVIAANPNNGIGTAGITWTNKVLPVKVMDATGHGMTSDLALGIDYAVQHGARIINLSLGGFPDEYLVKDAISRAWTAGAVVVAAAGNYRTSQPSYPASYPHVISVSATQADDEFTNWSNYGLNVDVAAPGAAVTTTNCNACNGWGDYTDISGTSFSTPNAAGVVALIMARYPAATNSWVVDRLLGTADDLGFAGWDDRYGRGRINAWRAVGGSPPATAAQIGDGWELNQAPGTARSLGFGTFSPTNYPAGDVDFFRFTAPRAGRIDVAVTPVVDSVRLPKSSLSFDPMLELWVNGALVKSVDNPTDSTAVERVSYQAAGPTAIVIGVRNWLPNGSRVAYPLSGAFVDNVAPTIVARSPGPGVSGFGDGSVTPTISFSEAVSGVGATTLGLRNAAGAAITASVTYDAAQRRATITPQWPLGGEQTFSVVVGPGIRDLAGNALAATSWQFTTGQLAYRLAGANRYATSATLSAATFAPGVPAAVLATGSGYPDALAGASLAKRLGGPVLLVGRDAIPAAVAAELSRLRPGRIVVLGGTASISSAVATAAAGYTSGGVTRISGSDRYATASAVSAKTSSPGVATAYVATGLGFPDALAGAAVAARDGAPVLLVSRWSVPASTAAELTRLHPGRIVVLGGSAVVSDGVLTALRGYTAGGVSRLAGSDRYATAVAISAANFAANGPDTVYVSAGANFPDSLSAGPIAGRGADPVLLVPRTSLPSAVAAEIARLNPSQVVVIGGSASVSDAVRGAIQALLD